MVLGPEKAKEVVRQEGLAVYMITKEGDGFKTWSSPQFNSFWSATKLKARLRVFIGGAQARSMYAYTRSRS